MPDFVKHSNGNVDWSKLFMGVAMAVVFVMQQYHAIQVEDLRANIVPRAEYTAHRENVMDKDIILAALKELNERIDDIEK